MKFIFLLLHEAFMTTNSFLYLFRIFHIFPVKQPLLLLLAIAKNKQPP